MLAIDGVSYRYRNGGTPALQQLSLSIPGGGVYGLLGPNGAGKTTLISLLAGLICSDTGSISVNGQRLDELRRDDARAIALVPQEYAFYPMLTVRENLQFFAGILDLGRVVRAQRIAESIAFARLEQVITQRAEHLSGGLRRRLNLAIGLLGKPRLLLLDEPTVGVDPQSRHFLLESIAALPASGTSVIYTSHYMEEVQAICQHLAILDQGRVLISGALDALLENADTVLELAGPAPLPASLVKRYAAQAQGGLSYRLELPSVQALPTLLAELETAGVRLVRLSFGQQNLEQVFMRLTQRSLRD